VPSEQRTWPPLEFRVRVPVSRPEAWRAFTASDQLSRWLARQAHGRVGAGETFELGWGDLRLACRVAQATHERVLRFSWPDPMGQLPETWVVVLFHDRGSWTLVELEHYGFGRGDEWDAAYVSAARAWSSYLKNLRSVLGGGPDLREDDE
jgi:uncharacterized protein YndB with AHSA1/START domain